MAEETLRYRIEVDEASLQSELARARGSITNVLQSAIQTGQYAVNNVHADLSLTRQLIGGPPSPVMASPRQELGFGAASVAALNPVTPPNMLTADFQEAAESEVRGRIRAATIGIGREAIPIATGLAGVFGGMARHAGPIGTLATGAAGFLGGQLLASPIFENIETRGTLEDILQATGSPHPGRPFTAEQRGQVARGIMQDVASDVRFGIEDASQLLAMGQSTDFFQGTRSAEEFRDRFRQMMEQVKTITRVFQQTTAEAMQTLGTMNQMGLVSPEVGTGRISDVLGLSRMSGLRPDQALQVGLAGAGMAQAQGIASGAGFDAMVQNAMVASVMESGRAVSPEMARQLGGVPGMAGILTRFNAGAAGQLQGILPAFANETMTGIDTAQLREFVQGGISFEDLQMRAADRLSDPAQQLRYASNRDLLQNQLATSNLAGPALFRVAEERAALTGARAEDVFGILGQQMGFDPMQREAILTATRDRATFQGLADHQRRQAMSEVEMERRREESRFSSRIAAGLEEVQQTLANTIGAPIASVGKFFGDVAEKVVTAPSRFFDFLDLKAGEMFGGAPPTDVMRGMTLSDFAQRRMLPTAEGLSDQGPLAGRLRPMRNTQILSEEEQQKQYSNAIQSILNRVELAEHRVTQSMSDTEKDAFQEAALTTFAPDIAALMEEEDPRRREEMEGKLRGRMGSWLKTNYGHLEGSDREGVQQFTRTMLNLEGKARFDETIKRGLQDALRAGTAIQAGQFATMEIPALLAMSAAGEGQRDRLIELGESIGAGFKGRADIASLRALQGLGEALPMLGKGTQLRERIEVTQKFLQQSFLRPGDMELDTKELASVREQNLSVGQASYVDELIKTARETEGHKITADVLFRSVGAGLHGSMVPSNTPPPGSQLDHTKSDLTAVTLDRLTGSVNNLSSASRELLTAAEKLHERTAGKL